jgi:hypothetical protein
LAEKNLKGLQVRRSHMTGMACQGSQADPGQLLRAHLILHRDYPSPCGPFEMAPVWCLKARAPASSGDG